MSGRNPPSYCTLTLIAMQGHQQKGRQTNTSSNNKDKSSTIIETSTSEDHDDENLHNPMLFSSHQPIEPQPNPVIYVVANPVRVLLDRKRSEEHLQSSNESKRKTQTNKNDKEKGTRITKCTCQKKIDEGHSIERVWHSASREPSDTLPGSQPCTQTRSIYHIPHSQIHLLIIRKQTVSPSLPNL